LAIQDFRRYFAGELTNKEIARVAIETFILIPFVDKKIADWLTRNMPNPDGKWRGLVPVVLAPEDEPGTESQAVGQTFGDILKHEEKIQTNRDWWKNNGLNQREAAVAKEAKKYGAEYNACGPVVLTMLINSYNIARGVDAEPLSANTLVGEAGDAGFFADDGLISFKELQSLANSHGYEIDPKPDDNGNAIMSIDELVTQVKAGSPACVLMRYGYDEERKYVPNAKKGFDHFVIVTEVSPDGKTFTVVNPHPGSNQTENSDVVPQEMTIDEFRSCWEYNKDQHKGQGVVLRPKG